MKIKLKHNQYVIIDDEDFNLVKNHNWYATFNSKWYVRAYIKKSKPYKIIYIHRLIMKAKKGQIVDHINGNPLDNRKSNLRFCTHSENIANQK